MKKRKFAFIILGVLFCLNVLAWTAVYSLNKHQLLEVTFFDVGQGDSSFIETSQGHQILIDGGPSSAILEKLGKEMPFWDRTIDLVILSHPEADHLTGLLEVLKMYKIENILWTGVIRDTPEYKEWVDLINKEDANIFIATVGQKISVGGVIFEIISPSENLEGRSFKDSNDTSIVARLVLGKESFLFTGDIYKSAEKEIIDRGLDISSNVLKVSHHGSKTSSSDDFLAKASPEVAVIFLEKNNSYGHPHQEVLDRLEKYAKILRTDQNGDIKIFSDGENLKIVNN